MLIICVSGCGCVCVCVFMRVCVALSGDRTHPVEYRGTSLMRSNASLGHYRRTMPRALRWS